MAGNPFIGNAGPAFDPETAPPVDSAVTGEVYDDEPVGWQPAKLRRIVKTQGITTHELVGVGQEDWLWRDSELDAIAEPLAAMLNEIPVARAAAAVSDEATVAAVLAEYCIRSVRERSRVLKARRAVQDRPSAAAASQAPVGAPHGFYGDNGASVTGVRPDDVGAVPATPVNPSAPPPDDGEDSTIWRVPGE